MDFKSIIREIKEKKYRPVYFLQGEESWYINQITNYIADNILTEEEKAFNQLVFYGKDTNVTDLVNTARRYPMMSDYQLIILKEGQQLKDIDQLSLYTENPQKSTILLVNYKYGTFDKRKKLLKSIEKCNGIVFNSPKLYDNQIPDWITSWLKGKNMSIEPGASMLLLEYLGNDLMKISGELEKLIIALPKNETNITPHTIERNIGISKDYNNFELQKALGKRDILKANRIVNHFSKNPNSNPLNPTIASLFFFFQKIFTLHFLKDKSNKNIASVLKINPYFVNEYKQAASKYSPKKTAAIISWLREVDLRSKGYGGTSSTENGELLKELVYLILH